MDSDTLWHYIDSERAALCDLLESLEADQWQHPSLCEGWTVRDVAAHLTLAQARVREVLGPFLASGFRPNAMSQIATARCTLTHEQIIEKIRSFIGSRRHVAIVSETEPLLDLLIHTQDIAVPLGIDHPMPTEPAVTSLDRVLRLNHLPWARLRSPLRGVRLIATDVDYSYGEAGDETLAGPIRWLLMFAAGRHVAADHLRRVPSGS